MNDRQRAEDRELWQAAQYSHIYGREYAQNYLAWSRAIPGIAFLALVCFAYPAILLIPLAILLLWGGTAVYRGTKASRLATAQRLAQEAAVQCHQAAVDRLVYDLQIALRSGDAAATGEVCKILALEEAFGFALPQLRLALGDIDPDQRLCALRGLRWGTHYMEARTAAHGSLRSAEEIMPSALLLGVLNDRRETTHLRVAAAIALGNGGYLESFDSLARCLADANPDVKAACCHALGRLIAQQRGDGYDRSRRGSDIPDPSRTAGLHLVLDALRDPYVRVRHEAAQALGEFHDPRSLRPLQELAADHAQPDAVRRAASAAVSAIKNGVGLGF